MRWRNKIGSLILIYIGFLCLIAWTLPAFANDLKLPNFDRNINKNGVFFGNTGTLWYSPATDTISADFVLETSWECEPDPENPTRCIENRPTFQARIFVKSALLIFELGDVEILPEEVQFRNPGSGTPPQNQQKAFSMTISGSGFEAWVSPRFDQGNLFKIHVVLNPDHKVPEDDYDNNEAAASVPDFVPLNGMLFFGPTPTALDGLTGLQEDSSTCGNSSGDSGMEAIFALTGSITWAPSSNDLWDDVSVSLPSPFCAEYVLSGDGFDLLSRTSASAGLASGQLGGHDVSIDTNTLDPVTGATPSKAAISLPQDHSFHSEDPDIGGLVARGKTIMVLNDVTPTNPADYNTIVASEAAPTADTTIGYIHSQGLPFSMRVRLYRVLEPTF